MQQRRKGSRPASIRSIHVSWPGVSKPGVRAAAESGDTFAGRTQLPARSMIDRHVGEGAAPKPLPQIMLLQTAMELSNSARPTAEDGWVGR